MKRPFVFLLRIPTEAPSSAWLTLYSYYQASCRCSVQRNVKKFQRFRRIFWVLEKTKTFPVRHRSNRLILISCRALLSIGNRISVWRVCKPSNVYGLIFFFLKKEHYVNFLQRNKNSYCCILLYYFKRTYIYIMYSKSTPTIRTFCRLNTRVSRVLVTIIDKSVEKQLDVKRGPHLFDESSPIVVPFPAAVHGPTSPISSYVTVVLILFFPLIRPAARVEVKICHEIACAFVVCRPKSPEHALGLTTDFSGKHRRTPRVRPMKLRSRTETIVGLGFLPTFLTVETQPNRNVTENRKRIWFAVNNVHGVIRCTP